MDFSKIKLVVSDMDGTLLNEKHEVSTRFLEQFKELKQQNIQFVAASGRQFHSIVDKLNSISEDISVIAENGAMMKNQDEVSVLLELAPEEIKQCIEVIRKIDDCYVVLCARKAAYIESNDVKFFNTLKQYYSVIKKVNNLNEVKNDDFLKIAIFHYSSTEKHVLPHVAHLKNQFQVMVSGQNWLDISHRDANKAYALNLIQKKFGFNKSETMVFGDYNNDLGMLELADFSFAMKNAHPNVKEIANYETKSNAEEGVEFILDKLISSRT